MAAAIPALIGGAVSLFNGSQQRKAQKKAQAQADARAAAITKKEKDQLEAFRTRISTGGRSLLGASGDDTLGNTLG